MTENTAEIDSQKNDLLKIELMQSDTDNDYMLYSKVEIAGILRTLVAQSTLMTVYFNEGNDFLMTTLLKLQPDSNTMILDIGGDNDMNQRALRAAKLICITSIDKVKIQFALHGIQPVQFEGRNSFLAEIPKAVLRLQRREFFRLLLPVTKPLKCRTLITNTDHSKTHFETTILDISGGGVGLIVPPADICFQTDMLLDNCQIELPGVGNIQVALRVRSIYEVIMLNGARSKRSGCQFINLSGQALTLVQRFIIKSERDRKARESGLA